MSAPRIDLTREAWLQAGQDLLRADGLRALRLRALTARLSISTGSFYHHFKDFDAYLGQLAEFYSGAQLQANLARIRERAESPMDRIRTAGALAREENLPRLALAMRAWAKSDPRAARSVEALDARLTGFFTDCLTAMGHTAEEASIRAYLLLGLSTVDLAPPAGLPKGDALDARILAIICTPPA